MALTFSGEAARLPCGRFVVLAFIGDDLTGERGSSQVSGGFGLSGEIDIHRDVSYCSPAMASTRLDQGEGLYEAVVAKAENSNGRRPRLTWRSELIRNCARSPKPMHRQMAWLSVMNQGLQ